MKQGTLIIVAVITMLLSSTLSCLILDTKSESLIKTKREGEERGETIEIGVISDTHVPTRAKEIPAAVFQIFQKTKYIIHAGDFVSPEVIVELEKIAPVVGVKGNMDYPSIEFPEVNSLEVMGWRIGVTHNSLSPFKMDKIKEVAKENNFDVLIFGHTHRPVIKKEGDILLLNPGSPTNPLFTSPSVALLRISKSSVDVEIIELKKK
jgi:hypothetical protein